MRRCAIRSFRPSSVSYTHLVMRHIPIFTFINKMDREARDPFELMSEIEEVLGIHNCPINWPIDVYKRQVKDFNLAIGDKEFIIFVGPSGCGKSTTLRMVAGLEEITSGDLYIDGKRMNDVEPKDRDIAMVFQNYALYPHMTVYDNMAFGLKIRKLPKEEIDKKVHEAAKILDLEHLLDRKPRHFPEDRDSVWPWAVPS